MVMFTFQFFPHPADPDPITNSLIGN